MLRSQQSPSHSKHRMISGNSTCVVIALQLLLHAACPFSFSLEESETAEGLT